jgi:hypothetical protein
MMLLRIPDELDSGPRRGQDEEADDREKRIPEFTEHVEPPLVKTAGGDARCGSKR